MKKGALLLLLLFLPSISAQDLFSSQTLLVEVTTSADLTITPKASPYTVSYVQADLAYVPQESYRQRVLDTTTSPPAEHLGSTQRFFWEHPPQQFSFSHTAQVSTSTAFKEVTKKAPFPLRNLESDLYPYVQPGEIIDTNDDIQQLAARLARNADDQYKVVYALATWVRNHIDYELSTSNAQASKKASWVLENRQGVCDELTSLFIALNRALGIPARFVSGIAYTNRADADQPWGPHGWAEVYFPGTGWVPFDVTYGEMGYVDAGHITLHRAPGPQASSVEYEYQGKNIHLEVSKLHFETDVVEEGSLIAPPSQLSVALHDDLVGYGSYNLVSATLRNLQDHYVIQDLAISTTRGLHYTSPQRVFVLLYPGETKTIHWIIQVDENLDQQSRYTFPVTVYSGWNQKKTLNFQARYGEKVYQYSVLEEAALTQTPSEEQQLLLSCTPQQEEVLREEAALVSCRLSHTSTEEQTVQVCFEQDCVQKYLAPGAFGEVSFTARFHQLGIQTLPVKASTSEETKTGYVVINVVDDPDLALVRVDTPNKVTYNEAVPLSFTLARISQAFPRNLSVHLEHPVVRYDWKVPVLHNNHTFTLNTVGKMLLPGTNTLQVTVQFTDSKGKRYDRVMSFEVYLENTTLVQQGFTYLNAWGVGIERVLTNHRDRERFLRSSTTWIILILMITLFFLPRLVRWVKRRPHRHVPKP